VEEPHTASAASRRPGPLTGATGRGSCEDERMARDNKLSDDSELLTGFDEGQPIDRGFETALRGYDKRQVDRYIATMQLQMDTLAGERAEALAQIDRLVVQVQQLQTQIQELRRRSAA